MTRLAPAALKKIIEEITPLVIGTNPLQPEATWEVLYATMMNRGHNRGFYIEAISGIDIALWDLRAKIYGQPLYMFLGGRQRDLIPSYASSLRMREKSVVLETARNFLAQGFKAMKIKLGKYPEQYMADLRLVEDIRKEVGDDVVLTVDANCGYHEDYKLALRVGRGLEANGIYWFEDLISPDDLYSYKYLCDHLDMAIAWGERAFTRYDFAAMSTEHTVGIVKAVGSREDEHLFGARVTSFPNRAVGSAPTAGVDEPPMHRKTPAGHSPMACQLCRIRHRPGGTDLYPAVNGTTANGVTCRTPGRSHAHSASGCTESRIKPDHLWHGWYRKLHSAPCPSVWGTPYYCLWREAVQASSCVHDPGSYAATRHL